MCDLCAGRLTHQNHLYFYWHKTKPTNEKKKKIMYTQWATQHDYHLKQTSIFFFLILVGSSKHESDIKITKIDG